MNRKVFISYYHKEDQKYKDRLSKRIEKFKIADNSLNTNDINDKVLKPATIYKKIREDYIRDSDLIIVLLGLETWKRKYVDWEIAAGLRRTKFSKRAGLLIIRLPDFVEKFGNEITQKNSGQRIYDNVKNKYAISINWNIFCDNLFDTVCEAISYSKKRTPKNNAPFRSRNNER